MSIMVLKLKPKVVHRIGREHEHEHEHAELDAVEERFVKKFATLLLGLASCDYPP